MGKYILKRLVYIVIVFFIVSLLMYALYNLIPGDPAYVLGQHGRAGRIPRAV